MKLTRLTLPLLIGLSLSYTSCSDDSDDVEKLCIAGPCGTIVSDQLNIAISTPAGGTLTDMTLTATDFNEPISLENLETNGLSCWDAVSLPTTTTSFSLNYLLDSETKTTQISTSAYVTNAIIVEVTSESVEVYDYDGECNDTPNG